MLVMDKHSWLPRCHRLLTVLAVCLLVACDPADDRAAGTRRLLADLREPARSDSARAALRSYFFQPADLPLLFEALQYDYPTDTLAGAGTRGLLLDLVPPLADGTTVRQLEDLFHRSETLPGVQRQVLRCLARIGSPQATTALLELLPAAEPWTTPDLERALAPLAAVPLQPHLAAMLPLADQPIYTPVVYDLLARQRAAGTLSAQDLRPFDETIERHWLARPAAPGLDTWPTARDQLLLIAGLAQDPRFNRLVESSLGATAAPFLQLAAIDACLTSRIPVSDSLVAALAAQSVVRLPLYTCLQQHQRSLPPAYLHQAAMASADLALWLARHGHAFSDLQQMDTLDTETGRLYVYRFRHQGAWRLGVSGPQPADTSRYEPGASLTGSALLPYRNARLREDVAAWVAGGGME
ncbi:MAG: hypothetical protein OHK0039_13320 [Bacteroidia bacterium]